MPNTSGMLSNFFHDILTGIDGKSFDIGRVAFLMAVLLWSAAMVLFFGVTVYAAIVLKEKDLVSAVTRGTWYMMLGAAAVHLGSMAGLGMKASTEPDPGCKPAAAPDSPSTEWTEGEEDRMWSRFDSTAALPWETIKVG